MKKVGRIIILVAVIVLLFVVIITSTTTKPSVADQIWDEQTTMGNKEAKNYYVLYTDMMCPYCAVLAQTIIHNEDKFEQYLADNDVLWEVRLTDYLYEGSGVATSRPAAEAAYCAKNEGKFWDFYHVAMEQMYQDYQSKGIGISKTSPQIKNVPDDYWKKIGEKVGLGEKFVNCMSNHDTVAEIQANTQKAAQVTEGIPYIYYNGKAGMIDGTNGWDTLKAYLDSGLKR